MRHRFKEGQQEIYSCDEAPKSETTALIRTGYTKGKWFLGKMMDGSGFRFFSYLLICEVLFCPFCGDDLHEDEKVKNEKDRCLMH